jgi:hypothetical protein
VGISALTVVAATTFAQDATVRYDTERERTRTEIVNTDESWCQYKANELSFDFFGTGTVGKRTLRRPSLNRIERNGRAGAGIGMEYFFHRYIGIEAEAYTENTDHNFIDNVNGNLIGRFPIGDSGVAPYIFGGGGRQLDPVYQWTLDAGAGLEWRFVSHVGVFLDGRYVWADKTKDYGLGRVGLRFGF